MTTSPSSLTNELLQLLADGRYHSGASLGQHFGVSRAAINHHIKKLSELGLNIFRVTGKGYRLASPLQLLQRDYILANVESTERQGPLRLKPVTSSTNDDVKHWLTEQPGLAPGAAVLAEMQTAGRGRRGRNWYSPYGSSLYLSLYWPLSEGFNAAIGLSIALGVGVAELLREQGIDDVAVKWPNDVYVGGRKIAGILVELEGQAGGEAQAIVGIGLNVQLPKQSDEHIHQQFTDLAQVTGAPPARNAWAAWLLSRARQILVEHENYGLSRFLSRWPALDMFYNQPVSLQLGQHEQLGICRGIDELGALLVEQEGAVKQFFGGEVSVRRATG